MRLLAVSAPARVGGVALPVRRRERGGDTRPASRARGAPPTGERPSCNPADRVFLAALARMLPRKRWGSVFVRPETIRRWHRSLLARRWTYPHRRPGRPATNAGVRALTVRLARENQRGATAAFRASSVGSAFGSRPAPFGRSCSRPASIRRRDARRKRGGSSCDPRASGIVACDFFTVDTVLFRRLYVPRVHRTRHPTGVSGGHHREPDRGVGDPSRHAISSTSSSNERSQSGS